MSPMILHLQLSGVPLSHVFQFSNLSASVQTFVKKFFQAFVRFPATIKPTLLLHFLDAWLLPASRLKIKTPPENPAHLRDALLPRSLCRGRPPWRPSAF